MVSPNCRYSKITRLTICLAAPQTARLFGQPKKCVFFTSLKIQFCKAKVGWCKAVWTAPKMCFLFTVIAQGCLDRQQGVCATISLPYAGIFFMFL
jgi:hypothetical protein